MTTLAVRAAGGLTLACHMLGAEGPDSGLAGQLSARADRLAPTTCCASALASTRRRGRRWVVPRSGPMRWKPIAADEDWAS